MRSASISAKRWGTKPFMRLIISPRRFTITVVGIDVTCRKVDKPSSK
jgi:hypothetical protein